MNKHLAIQLKLSDYRTVDSIRQYLYRDGRFPLGYMLPSVDGSPKRHPLILVLDVAGVTGISVADLYMGLRMKDTDTYTPFSGIQVMNCSKAKAPKVEGRSTVSQGLRTLSALLEEPFIVWEEGIGIGQPSVLVDNTVPNASELVNIVSIINVLNHRSYSIKESEFSEGLAAISPTTYIDSAQIAALGDSLDFLVKTGTHAFIARTHLHKALVYYIPNRFEWLDQLFLAQSLDEDEPEDEEDED